MIKRLLMIGLCLFLLVGCNIPNDDYEDNDMEQINTLESEQLKSDYMTWYGRNIYQNHRMYFYYTATGFKVSFYGRIIQIELMLDHKKNDIYYSIAKDGEDLLDAEVYIQTGHQVITVEFNDFANHTIEFVKRSEPEDGITSIKSIKTNGYFIKPEINGSKPLHFLLIGASGISGHGAIGLPGQPRTTANSSSLHSFGFLTARAFQGTYEFVSNSGWGIRYGYNDLTGEVNLYHAYQAVGIDNNQQIVDGEINNSKPPDVIIVNAGGNDYNAVINKASGFDKENKIRAFKDQVAIFILELREKYPNALIIWTMTSGSLNGNAALQVINQLEPSDKQFVKMVVIEDVGSNGNLAGANGHASYQTHLESTKSIVEAVSEFLS